MANGGLIQVILLGSLLLPEPSRSESTTSSVGRVWRKEPIKSSRQTVFDSAILAASRPTMIQTK